MAKRILDDWIKTYMQYTSHSEFPLMYHYWCAISAIAGAVERKVWIEWEPGRTIYANMYIILVGHSGLGKGEAMRPIISIFNELRRKNVIADAVTCEELSVQMSKGADNFLGPDNKTITHSSMQVFAKELSVLLGQKDLKMLSYLTDWFDCHDKWSKHTKHSDSEDIRGVYVNLLGATAPDWLDSILPVQATGGGFTSRVIFVVENDLAKLKPYPDKSIENIELKLDLVHDLQVISQVIGEFWLNQEALDFRAELYLDQHDPSRKQNTGWVIQQADEFEGYRSRRLLHLKKLGMIFALSRGSRGEIKKEDLVKGDKLLSATEKKMPLVFSSIGRSQLAAITGKIINFMQKYKKASRTQLLRAFYKDIDKPNLLIVEETLVDIGVLKIVSIGDDVEYEYIEKDQELTDIESLI